MSANPTTLRRRASRALVHAHPKGATVNRAEQRDSIDRAFTHHQLSGVVHTFSPPEQHRDGRSTWLVVFSNDTLSCVELTTPAALAVCKALAAAEHVHKRVTS